MAKQKKVNIKNEQMATPEQIATIENYIGESLQDFAIFMLTNTIPMVIIFKCD